MSASVEVELTDLKWLETFVSLESSLILVTELTELAASATLNSSNRFRPGLRDDATLVIDTSFLSSDGDWWCECCRAP